MPKTSAPQPRQTSIPSDLDVDSLQLSESHDEQPPSPKTAAVLRRRKNADAQAAFRARRTQYIANLEETVTSLEGAVRRLQDALRDSRDEIKELKDENKRLTAALESSGIDPRRWSRSPIPSASLGENLKPPYPHSGLTASPSLRNSPSHGADFSLTYAASSVSRSSRSPIPNEQQQSSTSFFSTSSPFDTTNVSGDQPTIFPPDSYSTPLNLVSGTDFLTSGQHSHSRQVSLEGPTRFVEFRPASAAGSDSSATGPAPFKHDVDTRSDNSSLSDATPAQHGQAPPLGMEMGFGDLSLFNNSIGSLPMDYGAGVQHQQTGQTTAHWDAAFYSESTFASQNNNQHQQETDLGRSDTVKASNYATVNRKISKGSQKHRRAYSSTADLHEVPPEPLMFMDESTANPYEFERFDRPGSASSGYSVGGDLGHGFPEPSTSNPNPPDVFAPSQLSRVKSARRHSFPVSAASPDAYGTESSEDFEMDYEQPPAGHYSITGSASAAGRPGFPASSSSSGIVAAAAAAAAASSKDPSMPPMSNTLAVIKAQAFGTVRKSRVRARRSGADSAAKVAMEALQARGLGMGLDVDLDLSPTGSGETSVSGRRQRQRKDEPS